jgi:hypothetical protein
MVCVTSPVLLVIKELVQYVGKVVRLDLGTMEHFVVSRRRMVEAVDTHGVLVTALTIAGCSEDVMQPTVMEIARRMVQLFIQDAEVVFIK